MALQFKQAALQEEMEENGFVKIPFLSDDEVEALSSFYTLGVEGNRSGFHCTMFSPESDYRKSVDQKIKEVFAARIDQNIGNARMLYANFMVKENGAESDFYLHQDWTYVDETRANSWAIWVPLTDTTVDNGALHVVPKTHRMTNNFRGPGIQDALEGLHESIRTEFGQPVEMKAGEAVLWDHRLVHFSPANVSGENRIAATVILVPEGEEVIHCRAGKSDRDVNIYSVDTEFYMSYNITENPALPILRSERIDATTISMNDLRSLIGVEDKRESVFQRVMDLFKG